MSKLTCIQKRTKGKDTPEMKSFALSLYHMSGKAYRLISKFFNLPSKKCLSNWVSDLPQSSGLTKAALDVIESKIKCMNDAMDEILYNSAKDEVVGVEDLGDGKRSERLAGAAIVFIVRGITGNWKQPLGYYLVHEACSSDVAREKLTQIIDQVTSIVSDLGSNFQKLLKI